MLRNCVSNTLRAISDKLRSRRSALAVDGLCVTALRGVGFVDGGCEAEDVGPLLELFGVWWVKEGRS